MPRPKKPTFSLQPWAQATCRPKKLPASVPHVATSCSRQATIPRKPSHQSLRSHSRITSRPITSASTRQQQEGEAPAPPPRAHTEARRRVSRPHSSPRVSARRTVNPHAPDHLHHSPATFRPCPPLAWPLALHGTKQTLTRVPAQSKTNEKVPRVPVFIRKRSHFPHFSRHDLYTLRLKFSL